MTLIKVPRPPKSAFNPNRPVNTLLKTQIDFLHKAERRLPPRYHSEIYVNAIKTEGEASRYIREVTEAIHQAHMDAAASRVRPTRKRKSVIEIAAVADRRSARRRSSQKKSRATTKRKAMPKKTGRKK